MKDIYINDRKNIKKRYSGRQKHTVSVMSFVTALLVIAIFAALIPMSVSERANEVAGLAFLDMILAICGMTMGARGAKNHAERFGLAVTGMVINTIMFIIMVSLFFIGL